MKTNTKRLCLFSLLTALIAVSSWVTLPFAVPVTLQTLAIYLVCLLLSGRDALICISLYIALGAVGLPVFSSFGAGIGALFGATGGYIIGFIFIPICTIIFTKIFGSKMRTKVAACIVGSILLYLFGAFWFFSVAYDKGTSLKAILYTCVLPFILPDAVKLFIAYAVSKRLRSFTEGISGR